MIGKTKFYSALAAALTACLCCASVSAKESVADIRSLYQTAKKAAAKADKGGSEYGEIPHKITTTLTRVWCGSGYQKCVYNLYINDEECEDGNLNPALYFATASWNWAAREYYIETLWNKKKEPVFFFYKATSDDMKNLNEYRLYFTNKKLFKVLIRKDGKDVFSGNSVPKEYIPNGFNSLINSDKTIKLFNDLFSALDGVPN